MSDRKLTGKGEKVREKMIAATVKILQQEGFKKATVRSIAKEADVNIASVRYYFGSKEELIGCALEYMMGNLENIVAYLDDTRLSAKERLKKYIIAYFHLARQHPALFRSISNPSSDDAKDTYFIYLSLLHSQCWSKVIRNIAEITGYTDPADLDLKAMQIFSAVEFPIILESNKADSFISNYTDSDTLSRYVDILLDNAEEKNEKKEYLKEIFDELRKYNRKVFKYVDKANDFILHENNFGTGNLFEIDKTDLKDYLDSYNHLLTILGEYKVLSKDKNVILYANDYDNLSRNAYAILEGINNIQIEFKRNIYGEIEETEEEIKQKKKDALKEFLMKKQSLTLSGETREYTYWLILHRFKEKHNKFYTYLIEKKLMK